MTSLESRIASRQAQVGVIGLGYVGLPLAVEIARQGFIVKGLDRDPGRVAEINSAEAQVNNCPAEVLNQLVEAGWLQSTADFSVLQELDIILICVPTPLTPTREPDLSYVVEAAGQVARYQRRDQLIVLESTSYPTTTEELLLPILSGNGLGVGEDFFLAFSPERIAPGLEDFTIKNIPKLVAGVTGRCSEMARLFYEQFVDRVITMSSPRAAEMSKLLENVFRCVNIALMNELMMLCDRMGVDIWEVIDAASTKPFGFMPFYPGPGLGGHCIPVDPFYLSWKATEYDFHTEFIELAGKINMAMPYYVVDRIAAALNGEHKSLGGSQVLILGVAYKRDIADVRNSPALKIVELLLARGAEVSYHDPFVAALKVQDRSYVSAPLSHDLLGGADCVVIVTDHSAVDYEAVAEKAKLVVDTRGVLRTLGLKSSLEKMG